MSYLRTSKVISISKKLTVKKRAIYKFFSSIKPVTSSFVNVCVCGFIGV